MRKLLRTTTVTLLAAAAAVGVSPAQAVSTDPLIEGAKLCTKLLPQYEKQYGIPAHLLSAIAATESGRYHNDLKIRIPWPWTINANGRGYYFDSKAEAIAAVKKLRSRGVQSIDVGCMQVNLYHHPEAFASLDEAFEPEHNIAYSATFLRALYNEDKSWKRAASSYHSRTKEKGTRYVGLVYDSWQRLVEKLRLAKLTVPASSISEMKGMRPKNGIQNTTQKTQTKRTDVVYAKNLPKSGEIRVASYQPPRMKSIAVRDAQVPQQDINYVAPSGVQTAEVRTVLPDTGVLRLDQPALGERKSGPTFIFND